MPVPVRLVLEAQSQVLVTLARLLVTLCLIEFTCHGKKALAMGNSKTREEGALGTRWPWRNDFKSISLLPPGFWGALLWAGAPQPVSGASTG